MILGRRRPAHLLYEQRWPISTAGWEDRMTRIELARSSGLSPAAVAEPTRHSLRAAIARPDDQHRPSLERRQVDTYHLADTGLVLQAPRERCRPAPVAIRAGEPDRLRRSERLEPHRQAGHCRRAGLWARPAGVGQSGQVDQVEH